MSATTRLTANADRRRHERTAPRPETAVAAATSVDELRSALEELDAGPLHLAFRPGAVDLSTYDATAAVWETVFIEGTVEGLEGDVRRATVVDSGSLRTSLADSATIRLRLGDNGALTAGDVVLTPANDRVPTPPRPDASGVLKARLTLPPSASVKLVLRLEGPNVCVPRSVRERFAQRRVSSVSLFERDGDWFLSGVQNGSPDVVLVGAVGVY